MWNIVNQALNKLNLNEEPREQNQTGPPQNTYISQIAAQYLPMLGFDEPTRSQKPDPLAAKRNWIDEQLKPLTAEFTSPKNISLVVGSWNVAGGMPRSFKTISAWLQLDKHEADIYVVGLQEIEMTASSLWYEETERGMQWASMLADVFRKRDTKYLCMRVHQLSGLFATVYIKQEHKKYVDGIKSQVVRVGFMGVMGNKGSICFRFRLYHTTFCFIMAHLAPHTDQVAQRNQQFHDIMRTCTFEDPTGSLLPARHDVLIFGGDLNYRIARPYEHVMSAIERNDLDFLTSNDQLYEEIERETAFVGFSEPRLNFLPTYRFDVGTVQYDSSEKKRTPAYADRILYKVNPRTAKIQPIQYVSAQSTMISDHKPVLAEFDVVARVRDPEKYKKLYEVYEKKYYQQEANNRFPEIEEWDLVDDKYDHNRL